MQQLDQTDADMQITAESLGNQLRSALPIKRIMSTSIHDRNGNTLWLSEGQLGPDEHNVVLEAITVFEVEGDRAYVSEDLGGGRSAAFFASFTPHGELVGMAMVIADTRSIDALGAAKLVTPNVRSIMQRLAIVLKPVSTDATSKSLRALSKTGKHRKISLASAESMPASRPARGTEIGPQASAHNITALPGERVAPAAAATVPTASTSAHATVAVAEISLHVQQLMKLRSGGRTRRYEVLVRGRQAAHGDAMSEQLVRALSLRESAAAIDRQVVSQLTNWLKQHPTVWNSDPASFSINLSHGSLIDTSFIPFVAQTLQESGVAPDTIGFEIPEQAYLKHRDACAAFMDSCEKIGCYVVIDDFSMHSDVVPFLASRALRVVKIDPRLTQSAMRDRLAQALVIAISQSSKVLGLHCVAKRIDSAATRQWLSAVGIDFAQGFVMEDPQPIDALGNPSQRPAGRPSSTR